MPCNYNPITGEVETLYERYEREFYNYNGHLDAVLYWQYIDEKIDNLKEKIKLSQGENTNAKT